MQTGPRIASLYRYPVKGLSPEALDRVRLTAGETLPFDRAFAIEAGGGSFNMENPRHLPKSMFLMLMRDERLALLRSRFDPESGILTLLRDGKQVARGDLGQRIGRQMLEQFFAAFMADEPRGAPRIVHAPGHSFCDAAKKVVSVINLASVREIERVVGRFVDPLRFRANIYVEGLPAWAEFNWVDHKIALGDDARLADFERIQRCAATNVDPSSAHRDMNIPRTLMDAFGHCDCGVYARVATGGEIGTGQEIRPGVADD
jgi:hypothetical protein